jgi:hypothetical protein
MDDETAGPKVKVPKLEPVPYVVVKRADGSKALRHPDELKKQGTGNR